MNINNGLLSLVVLLLFAATPALANRVDTGPSGQGSFPNSNSPIPSTNPNDCAYDPTNFGFGVDFNGAPCYVIAPFPSGNIGQFLAFQQYQIVDSDFATDGIKDAVPVSQGLLIYEVPNFANDSSVTFTFNFDPTLSTTPNFGSFVCSIGLNPIPSTSAASAFCVNNLTPLNGSAGPNDTFTFFFPPGTSTNNPQNPSNWFFAVDVLNNPGDKVTDITVATPEPSTQMLLLFGILGLAMIVRRRPREHLIFPKAIV